MTALVRKILTCLFSKNTSYVCKPNDSFSLPLHFFCTSSDQQHPSNLSVYDFLLHKHQFSAKVASQVASVLTQLQNPEKSDSILSFLKESGFSNTQLEKIVKYRPGFLLASLENNIKPKIKIFQDLGFSSNDIAKIISSNPVILQLNENTRIIPSLSVLKGLLGSNDDVAKLLRKSGWFLIKDLETTMVPNIDFLKSCGIPMERILRLLYNYPRCLLLKTEILSKYVEKAEVMGFNRSSNMFIYAIGIFASMTNETWELKLQAFRNFGFSEGDISTMFRKAPQLFGGSMEKIKKTQEFLLATRRYNMSSIITNPISLACSIEKRYEPRLRILGILESRNLIKKWPNLGTIYSISNEKFFERFVGPYLNEVGEVYITKTSVRGQREKKLEASD